MYQEVFSFFSLDARDASQKKVTPSIQNLPAYLLDVVTYGRALASSAQESTSPEAAQHAPDPISEPTVAHVVLYRSLDIITQEAQRIENPQKREVRTADCLEYVPAVVIYYM